MSKMETRYQTLLKLGENFKTLVRIGIIPIHLTMWKVVYESVEEEKKEYENSQAVKNVAYKYDLQRTYVYKILQYMNTTHQIQ